MTYVYASWFPVPHHPLLWELVYGSQYLSFQLDGFVPVDDAPEDELYKDQGNADVGVVWKSRGDNYLDICFEVVGHADNDMFARKTRCRDLATRQRRLWENPHSAVAPDPTCFIISRTACMGRLGLISYRAELSRDMHARCPREVDHYCVGGVISTLLFYLGAYASPWLINQPREPVLLHLLPEEQHLPSNSPRTIKSRDQMIARRVVFGGCLYISPCTAPLVFHDLTIPRTPAGLYLRSEWLIRFPEPNHFSSDPVCMRSYQDPVAKKEKCEYDHTDSQITIFGGQVLRTKVVRKEYKAQANRTGHRRAARGAQWMRLQVLRNGNDRDRSMGDDVPGRLKSILSSSADGEFIFSSLEVMVQVGKKNGERGVGNATAGPTTFYHMKTSRKRLMKSLPECPHGRFELLNSLSQTKVEGQ
ncbi:hypothetical protein F5141DRAFT_1204704 [Pisolithus sp. B1]|nr:hypothetical protein F5141DRAFT_1204704 [Pisolithus sp. B1]